MAQFPQYEKSVYHQILYKVDPYYKHCSLQRFAFSHAVQLWDSAPDQELRCMSSEVKVRSPRHWATRTFPHTLLYLIASLFIMHHECYENHTLKQGCKQARYFHNILHLHQLFTPTANSVRHIRADQHMAVRTGLAKTLMPSVLHPRVT